MFHLHRFDKGLCMLRFRKIISICSLIVISNLFSTSYIVKADTSFTSIEVNGNYRIETATILSVADTPLNIPLSDSDVNGSLQRLMSSKLFEKVEFKIDNSVLKIAVKEFPTINEISIEGNKQLKDEQLIKLISSKPLKVYSTSLATSDAEKIAEAYSNVGRITAEVKPFIIRRSDNRVDLVFEVFEGQVIEVTRLSFIGNRNFSDRRLKRVLQTKQAGLLRKFSYNDTFAKDRIELDKQLLRDFYSLRGYIDFKVLSTTSVLTRQRDGFFVTFKIDEGFSYTLGDISVSSNLSGVELEGFSEIINLKPGVAFSPKHMNEAISRVEKLASDKGFNFIRVNPIVVRNDATRTLDVTFDFVRGPKVFVERIDISGNSTTIDRVIRQQFDTVEGDPFNPRHIREASARINSLRFFEPISMNSKPGSDDNNIIIDLKVKEVPTGSLTFGASYGQAAGFGGNIKIEQRNLLGRGQSLSLSIDTAANTKTYSINFGEPKILGRNLNFGIHVFNTTTNNQFSAYDTSSYGISPSISFPLSKYGNTSLYYSVGARRLVNLLSSSSRVLQNESSIRKSSIIGAAYQFDTRKTGFNPDAGVNFTLSQELAGLGGGTQYLKMKALLSGQTELFDGDLGLMGAIEAGRLQNFSGASSVLNRFFASGGGIRGFEHHGMGPRDISATNNDALGGNLFAAARFESKFPIGFLENYGMSGGSFYDIGSVWKLDNTTGTSGTVDDGFSLRSSVGLSLFWKTIVGPLRINYSKVLAKKSYDKSQILELTVSTQF